MNVKLRKKLCVGGLGVASALALSAVSIFGVAAAAQADYVSPEELLDVGSGPWIASGWYEGETPVAPTFTECSIAFNDIGGFIAYLFDDGSRPTGVEQVTALISSIYTSVPQGGGFVEVLIDRDLANASGTADILVEVPVGVHGVDLDAIANVYDTPELELPADATVRDVLEALDAAGDEFTVAELAFFSEEAAEVQWIAFGSETYWFGTDAEWFLNDPSCGTVVPEPAPSPSPAPTPSPAPSPTKPLRVETAA